jgi:hypothetical protein
MAEVGHSQLDLAVASCFAGRNFVDFDTPFFCRFCVLDACSITGRRRDASNVNCAVHERGVWTAGLKRVDLLRVDTSRSTSHFDIAGI